jgi:hypothetical protein
MSTINDDNELTYYFMLWLDHAKRGENWLKTVYSVTRRNSVPMEALDALLALSLD